MHAVLAKVVAREAQRLLDSPELTPEQLDTLEILCRCAKALNLDVPPADEAEQDEPTVEGDLALVEP